MGDFHEHVLFGFLLAAVTVYVLGEVDITSSEAVISVILVFIGSVLPDIDNKNAYVHRSVKAMTSISAGLFLLLFIPADIVYRFAASILALVAVYLLLDAVKIKHRGITHTLSFCVTLSSLVVVIGVYLLGSAVPGTALGLGLISHLLLDQEFRL